MTTMIVGAALFGLVIGWICYRQLRRETAGAKVSDIATVIGAVGGGAVVGLFPGDLFGWYAIGLAVGFFGYLVLGHTLFRNSGWLGSGS